MASRCTGTQTAQNSKIYVGAPLSDCEEPPAFRAELDGVVAANATTLTFLTDLPLGLFLPDGWFFNVISPTGQESLVQVSVDTLVSAAGVLTLTIVGNHGGFATGSEIFYPVLLRGREAVNIQHSGTRASSVTVDNAGATGGQTVSHNSTVDFSGDYNPLDAGFLNWRNALLGRTSKSQDAVPNDRTVTAPRNMYMWAIDPKRQGTLNTHGEVIHGNRNISGACKTGSATAITKSNLTGEIDGNLFIEQESTNANGYFGIAGLG